ncbi:MAG TPA: hypothetical protein VIL99_14315 [Ignavibacteria bacterium]
MYYKKSIKKEEKLVKEELLSDFYHLMQLCSGSIGNLSLHCKYDIGDDRNKYYEEDIILYLIPIENDNIKVFIKTWGMEKTEEFPNDLKFLLGSYKGKLIGLD